jgi:hypothetical protein
VSHGYRRSPPVLPVTTTAKSNRPGSIPARTKPYAGGQRTFRATGSASSDVHLPVTRTRQPAWLDGSAPRRIPPDGQEELRRDPGPIPPGPGSPGVSRRPGSGPMVGTCYAL